MTRNVKISLSIVLALAIALVVVAASGVGDDGSADPAESAATGTAATTVEVLRDDTHVLQRGGPGSPTLVEFLDFECEGCGALYPVIEELRERYRGRVTFAIRYFPLPGHANAIPAALAVEAAARQGRLEPMYRTMYETQREWGEARESRAQTFLGFARRLGLDIDRFRADLADPATLARVESDQADGEALGVQATPTLFLDGRLLELTSVEQLQADIEAALAER